jgi:hypothetical protein
MHARSEDKRQARTRAPSFDEGIPDQRALHVRTSFSSRPGKEKTQRVPHERGYKKKLRVLLRVLFIGLVICAQNGGVLLTVP